MRVAAIAVQVALRAPRYFLCGGEVLEKALRDAAGEARYAAKARHIYSSRSALCFCGAEAARMRARVRQRLFDVELFTLSSMTRLPFDAALSYDAAHLPRVIDGYAALTVAACLMSLLWRSHACRCKDSMPIFYVVATS